MDNVLVFGSSDPGSNTDSDVSSHLSETTCTGGMMSGGNPTTSPSNPSPSRDYTTLDDDRRDIWSKRRMCRLTRLTSTKIRTTGKKHRNNAQGRNIEYYTGVYLGVVWSILSRAIAF